MNKRQLIHTCAWIALGVSSLATHAQEFPPKKTITMVVGFAAGGAADTAARIIAGIISFTKLFSAVKEHAPRNDAAGNEIAAAHAVRIPELTWQINHTGIPPLTAHAASTTDIRQSQWIEDSSQAIDAASRCVNLERYVDRVSVNVHRHAAARTTAAAFAFKHSAFFVSESQECHVIRLGMA